MLQVLRIVAIALFTIVAGSVGYAYAASTSGVAGPGVDGAGAISGYRVESISYALNSLDPTRIDAVSFDLDVGTLSGVLSTVKVKLGSASDTWHTCTVAETTPSARATCVIPMAVAVADVNELHVMAAQ